MRNWSRSRLLGLERLEGRQLLAVVLDTGTLNITGSSKSDRISVVSEGNELVVRVNKQSSRFTASDVTQLSIDGRGGNDWISVDGNVLINSVIHGGNGNDRIFSGGGNDSLYGDKGNDRLRGGGGDDVLMGGVGNDWEFGDDGNDTAHGDVGNDHLIGGAGLDQLYGDLGVDQLLGGDGDDQLFGGVANDQLWGEGGNDILKGNAGNDLLNGGEGDNLLDGDAGHNQLSNGFTVDLDLQLYAPLTGSTSVVGTASYGQVVDNGQLATVLDVEVENATPTTVYSVNINNQLVGSIIVQGDGRGSLKYSTNPDNTTTFPFPPLPSGWEPHAGSVIDIGTDLTGSFGTVFPA